MILYLHGFRSSPQSMKAQLMAKAMTDRGLEKHIFMPQLPPSPAESMELCTEIIAKNRDKNHPMTIIGSSLGGYYATYLAEQNDCQAVLINPAIYATRDLSTQLGPMTYFYDDRPFEFSLTNLYELESLFQSKITAERYLLLAGDRDEVLDWQEMAKRYEGAKQIIVPDATHSFDCFGDYIEAILAFAHYT
ncbi:MAG: hypothetical protein GX822_04735 [Alcaligenaceae bacterium]|nr:hypothetical protein [Alcaligenaceae bacterium]HZJ97125.1 YqiA/YcfP family alpha/beta fold hydrolase [Oligella sp.]